MEYGKIKGVDKPISRILFGTVGQNFTMGRDNCALLDAAVEAGITTIDTARKYAFAEKSLGMWLKKDGNREKVVILSKCAHPGLFGNARVNETAIRNDFVVSTRNLCTDYIDIYLLHRDDTSLGVDVAVEVMNAPSGRTLQVYPPTAQVHLRCAFPIVKDPLASFKLYVDWKDFSSSLSGRCAPRVQRLPAGVLEYQVEPEVFDCIEVH